MKPLRMLALLLVAAQGAGLLFADAAQAADERYTVHEAALLQVLDATGSRPLQERLAALSSLAQQPAFARPRHRALVLLEQCGMVGAEDPESASVAAALVQLEDEAGSADAAVAIARQGCELIRRRESGSQEGTFEIRRRSYLDSAALGMPLLRYRLATDYARDALALGFVDEALQAVQVALRIAQANEDGPYHRDSLMDLALIQADMGQHEDARRNSLAALALAGGDDRLDMLLNRGYILLRADAPAEALPVYSRVRAMASERGEPESELAALLNMVDALTRVDRRREALALTVDALQLAQDVGRDYYIGYASIARAHALLEDGQVRDAIDLHARGRALMERAGEHTHVAKGLVAWAHLLAAQGRDREAYAALAQSIAMDTEARSAERQRNAQYLSAAFEAAQKDVAIERLRRQNEVAQLQIEKRRLGTAAWGVGLGAVTIVALVLLLSFLRLRRSSRRLAQANAQLDYENAHDTLTRIHNRAYFIRWFDERTRKGPGRAMLALLDIDHFKQINDGHGHAAGDVVLREAAARFASALRGTDLVARWGGEEFLVFADALDEGDGAADIAERLRMALARSAIEVDGKTLPVTVSIGYAELRIGPDSDLQAELERADAHLYQAKREGRNRAIGG